MKKELKQPASEKKQVASIIKTQADEYDEMVAYKNLRQKRKRKVALRILLYALIIILVPIMVFFTIIVISPTKGHNFFGYTFYIVATESMEPELMVGDCIVVKKVSSPEELQVGSDITFVRSTDGEVVTHRIIEVQKDGSSYKYVTKGINRKTADETPVEFENVLGKRVANLAFLGQTVTFFRSALGVVVMVLIFMAIVVGFIISFRMSEDIKAIGK